MNYCTWNLRIWLEIGKQWWPWQAPDVEFWTEDVMALLFKLDLWFCLSYCKTTSRYIHVYTYFSFKMLFFILWYICLIPRIHQLIKTGTKRDNFLLGETGAVMPYSFLSERKTVLKFFACCTRSIMHHKYS